jgi:hypothetical protein
MNQTVNHNGIELALGDVLLFLNNFSNPHNDKMKNREFIIKRFLKKTIVFAPKSAAYKQPDGTYKIEGEEEIKFKWVDFNNYESTAINIYEKPKKRGRKRKNLNSASKKDNMLLLLTLLLLLDSFYDFFW